MSIFRLLGPACQILWELKIGSGTLTRWWCSAKKIATLHPKIRNDATGFINAAAKDLEITLCVTDALRTVSQQDALYAKGRTEAGSIVTNAKGGESIHNYGLAFDVVEIKNGLALWSNPNWGTIGSLGKSFGFEWGGDWLSLQDRPHFQKTFGHTLSDLQTLYAANKLTEAYVAI